MSRALVRSCALVTLLAAASLSACGDDSAQSSTAQSSTAQSSTAQSSGSETASSTAAAASEVPALLDFTAPLVGGGTFDGAALTGRAVAFWFWAPT